MGSEKEFTRAAYFIMDVDLSRVARGPEAARAVGCGRHRCARTDAAV